MKKYLRTVNETVIDRCSITVIYPGVECPYGRKDARMAEKDATNCESKQPERVPVSLYAGL